MDDTILKQKQAQENKDRKNSNYKRLFLIIIAILFFSAIAILSLVLEKPSNKWTLDNKGPYDSQSVITSIIASSCDSSPLTPKTVDSSNEDKYPVYIVGEICSPGIYQVETGMFLYQLVEMAGGLTEKAARDFINLAFKITKNQMIKIPSIDEIKNGEVGGVADGLLLGKEYGFDDNVEQNGVSSKININTANETDLDKLPGIGIATAKLIIDYRTKNGNFKKIEDIMKIPGIKESKFTQIKDQITV